jgi:Uma2 family endonuclease
VSAKTLISVAEFDRLEPPDELRYELDQGELIEMVKPRYRPHNRIVMKITDALLEYLRKNPIGEVLTSDNLFVLGPNTKRIPDLSFMTTERVRQIQPDADIEGAPDLAIEVLSPSDTATAMRKKVKQYFTAGCRAVWLVYPESREIEVWESVTGPAKIVSADDTLEAPEVLPGFSAKAGALF